MIGRTVAHYRVAEKIGAGGMGEVWRARDTRLNRDVALKVLSDDLAGDPKRMARFNREARVLASLNHSNIGAIYGVESFDGKSALVLELVDGEDLLGRLREAPLPIEEALDIARQIAEGLEAAHDRGVVHRDLKPANVKVTTSGQVKVLDFGLAKPLERDSNADSNDASSLPPTVTEVATRAGAILGTAAYMSPEQAKGKDVDRRTDIFSFGALLFELMTRERCFSGETVSELLAAVLKEEPAWEQLPSATPPSVVHLLRRCLEKDPQQRLQSIGEARIALQAVVRGDSGAMLAGSAPSDASMEAETGQPRLLRFPIVLIALALVAAGAGIVGWQFGRPDEKSRVVKFAITPNNLRTGAGYAPKISPDGRRIVYAADGRLWIRDLDEREPREVHGSDGGRVPFWSPDGRSLAFAVGRSLMRVAAEGGVATTLSELPFSRLDGATWAEDDLLYLAPPAGPMYRISSLGGDAEVFLNLDEETDFHSPHALPAGRGILYAVHRSQGVDTIEILADGERHVLLRQEGERIDSAVYADSGHILYERRHHNPGVWVLPYSLSSRRATGEPFLLDAEGRAPSVSRDGTLLYSTNLNAQSELVWVDRRGRIEGSAGPRRPNLAFPELSPDLRSALPSSAVEDDLDVWMLDIQRATWQRMTSGDETQWSGQWHPSGNRVLIDTEYGANQRMHEVAVGAGAGSQSVTYGGSLASIDRDARWMVLMVYTPDQTGMDIGYLNLEKGGDVQLLAASDSYDVAPVISPDGRYVAYASGESGERQVMLVDFPSGAGKRQVSSDGGDWPRWSRDGTELFFISPDPRPALMSVSVTRDKGLQLGLPVKLFDKEERPELIWSETNWRRYDVAMDRERFLMVRSVADRTIEEPGLVVTLDWLAAVSVNDGR